MTAAPDFPFPLLDGPRIRANNQLGRCVCDSFGFVEPYLDEIDSWISMPLRLVHDQAADWHLELGPYSLGRDDIDKLRVAIAAYDEATGVAPPESQGRTSN